ncbi:NB-ARC domains-containing protein [Tanacetum coccineum]
MSIKSSELTTDALGNMVNLKLLQLKFVQLYGSYENFPKDLRWLCWHGFHIRTLPSYLYMGNTVVIDMSYSKLEVFEPPMLIKSLRILNLKESHSLLEVHNISLFPNLENLNLSCCRVLVHICETLKDLSNLIVLNLTKCEKLFKGDQDQRPTKKPFFSFPNSLELLILKDCNFEVTDYFSLSFSDQSFLQHLDLGNNLFEVLPSYSHLKQLRVLDLSFCPRLKWLLSLPNTLEELYINNCEKLEMMLYEFDIMSTSLPDTKDPNMAQYLSESSSVCFDVPTYPKNRTLKGLNVTFKYTISGDDSVWFAKINTNGVDLIYNPTVFGKPGLGEAGIWFSFWPIGNKLATGDKVNVSIIVMSGLEVIECGASLVYSYDVANETLENTTGWVETLGGDLSGFQLSTGAYYLSRRDLFELAEVGRLTSDWLEILVGDTVDKAGMSLLSIKL